MILIERRAGQEGVRPCHAVARSAAVGGELLGVEVEVAVVGRGADVDLELLQADTAIVTTTNRHIALIVRIGCAPSVLVARHR